MIQEKDAPAKPSTPHLDSRTREREASELSAIGARIVYEAVRPADPDPEQLQR
jgi:hypothetical protein